MSATDVRAIVHDALSTVQGTNHHLGLVTLQVLTDRVTEAVAPLVPDTTIPAAEAKMLPKADVVAWLVKKAREFRADGERQHADVASLLASKVARGAVRPDNLQMLPGTDEDPAAGGATAEAWPGELHAARTLIRALRAAMLAHDNPDLGRRLLSAHTAVEARALEGQETEDFFQPGRLYAHGVYRFRCEYLTTHPTSGRTSAWGWFGKQGAGWRHAAFSERQFQVRAWKVVAEDGDAR